MRPSVCPSVHAARGRSPSRRESACAAALRLPGAFFIAAAAHHVPAPPGPGAAVPPAPPVARGQTHSLCSPGVPAKAGAWLHRGAQLRLHSTCERWNLPLGSPNARSSRISPQLQPHLSFLFLPLGQPFPSWAPFCVNPPSARGPATAGILWLWIWKFGLLFLEAS